MKNCKFFCQNLQYIKNYQPLKKEAIFWQLFNLEELNCCLRWDSNPGHCASQSDTLTTSPNFLLKVFWKIFKQVFKRYSQSFCSRVASWIDQQSAISFEKTKNQKCSYLLTYTEFFSEIFTIKESTQSKAHLC